MKRPLALIFGAILAVLLVGVASAQTSLLTVSLPQGPVGDVVATVNGQVCGTATTSATGVTTLTLDSSNAVCVTPGATITFTSNGVAVGSTLTVPASGSGSLTLGDLDPEDEVNITIPAVASGSGTISAVVDGQVCGTANVSGTSATVISLPAACAVPGATISFTGAGGATLTGTLTVPASGGGTLTLSDLTATAPVVVNLPAGSGSVTAMVNGQVCGTAALDADGSTLMLPASCALAGGTLTFVTSGGLQLDASFDVPAGGALTVADLSAEPVRLLLPSGPVGSVTAMIGAQVCGSADISATAVTALVLAEACSQPGATITFVTDNGVNLGSTVVIPATIDAVLSLQVLTPESPLNIVLPEGDGEVDIFIDANLCATVDLSAAATVTASILATCIVPGGVISFEVDGTLSSSVMVVPTSGAGTVVVTDLGVVQTPAPTVPGPADTGMGANAMRGQSSALPGMLLGIALLGGIVAAGAAVRQRIRE